MKERYRMLEKNIVRVNGKKGTKRAHVDIEVPLGKLNIRGREDELVPYYLDDSMVKKAFEMGLSEVTSINAYNWVGDERLTTRIW